MAGVANAVDRCVISRFITCSRAVYSAMMQRKISSPYALGVTSKSTYERPSGARLRKLESRGGDAMEALSLSDV